MDSGLGRLVGSRLVGFQGGKFNNQQSTTTMTINELVSEIMRRKADAQSPEIAGAFDDLLWWISDEIELEIERGE